MECDTESKIPIPHTKAAPSMQKIYTLKRGGQFCMLVYVLMTGVSLSECTLSFYISINMHLLTCIRNFTPVKLI